MVSQYILNIMLNFPSFRNQWTEIMWIQLDRWDGYSCFLLSEHSKRCSLLNNYISDYWSNLDAKTGKSLLVYALGRPGNTWYRKEQERYDFLNEEERLEFEFTINDFKNKSKEEIDELRADVHEFLAPLEKSLGKKLKLPVIAFFLFDKESSYEQICKYDIFRIPKFKKEEEVEEYLFKLFSIAKKSYNEKLPYEKFITKVKLEGYKRQFLGHAKTGINVLAEVLPFIPSLTGK